MRSPFTWLSLEDHASTYLRGELSPDATPMFEGAAKAVRAQPVLSGALATLAVGVVWAAWRCVRPAEHAKQA